MLDLTHRLIDGEQVAGDLADAVRRLDALYTCPPGRRASDGYINRQRMGEPPTTGDPAEDLERRILWDGRGYLAVPVVQVRRTWPGLLPVGVLTLPDPLPADGDVLLHWGLCAISPLLHSIATGGDVDEKVKHMAGRVVHSRALPWE
ncbi:hypothetical protein [Micromonospora echinospora]|uniref:hypothetical protein n=1 Tax=Micromonospora echinospora TaxID=1877 RepID=UPI003A8C2F16